MKKIFGTTATYWRYTCGLLILTIAALIATGCARREVVNPSSPIAPVSASQKLGVRLVQDLMNDPKITKSSKISVGTFEKTVILNGRVASAAEKAQIGHVAKKKAVGYQIINKLVVSAPAKAKITNKSVVHKP